MTYPAFQPLPRPGRVPARNEIVLSSPLPPAIGVFVLALGEVARTFCTTRSMKTRLLWALILSVGGTASYFGIVRPDASTTPKRIQDFVDQDPASRPAIQLPPLVVSESRLPAPPPDPAGSAGRSPDLPPRDKLTIDKNAGLKDPDAAP